MNDVARRFVDASRRGAPFDLRGMPGSELVAAGIEIVDDPEAPDYFRALVALGTDEGEEAAVQLMAAVADPGVMAEAVRLLPALKLDDRIARSLHRALVDQSASRDRYHATRSHALLGAMYVAQDRPSLLRALQSHLLDVGMDDDGDYLRHVARIQGLVLAHVPDKDLHRQLELLLDVPDAEDEASFSLGLLDIADGLGDPNRATAVASFAKANERMKQAVATTEARHDAALYSSCLEVLLAFQQGNRGHDLQQKIFSIRDFAFDYAAILLPSDRDVDRRTWLGSSLLEGIRWSELGIRLASLDFSLIKKAWLDAVRVIEEELVVVFNASRSILKRSDEGGIEAITRPLIASSIQAERSRLALLDQWLADNSDSASAPSVRVMRAQIELALEASLQRNPTEAAGAPATAAEILAGDQVPAELRANALDMLAQSMSADFFRTTDPSVATIMERLETKLAANPDYDGPAAEFFRLILYHTLSFVASRENLTQKSVGGIEYLFNLSKETPPVEADLHRDYFNSLQYGPLRETAEREVPGIGHGRADIFFQRLGIKTVAELKKTDVDLTLSELVEEYGLQTTSYQRTKVRFCILMVLDLIDRGGGSDHLTNLVDVIRKKPASGQAEYSVVVFRVQGRKRSPSSL